MLLVAGRRVELIIEGHVDHRFNQMKINEKNMSDIQDFQLFLQKSPYPAYQIPKLKPVKGSRRPFLGFSDLRYHLNIKGA